MLRSSIDLGTNTCLLLIADCDPVTLRVHRIVSDHNTVVRLGEGVDVAKALQPQAMERTLSCLKSYAKTVADAGLNPRDTICVATSSSRDSKNGPEFFSIVDKETGFHFRVISGGDEAKFTFLGALPPELDSATTAVIDIGGGSTEFITPEGPGVSLDVGSVRFTERFFKSDPVTDHEFWACQESIDTILSSAQHWLLERRFGTKVGIKNWVAVAGTATTLASIHLELPHYDADALNRCVLTRGDVHRWVEELKWRNSAERLAMTGMSKGREDVLLAGAMVLWRSMELLNIPEIRISTRGLRFGVMQLRER